MIAELQQAVAKYAHALDELNVPEPETVRPPRGELVVARGRGALLHQGRLHLGGRPPLQELRFCGQYCDACTDLDAEGGCLYVLRQG